MSPLPASGPDEVVTRSAMAPNTRASAPHVIS